MAAAAQTKVTPTCKEYRKFQGKKKKKTDCSKRKNKAPRASIITEEGINFLPWKNLQYIDMALIIFFLYLVIVESSKFLQALSMYCLCYPKANANTKTNTSSSKF